MKTGRNPADLASSLLPPSQPVSPEFSSGWLPVIFKENTHTLSNQAAKWGLTHRAQGTLTPPLSHTEVRALPQDPPGGTKSKTEGETPSLCQTPDLHLH